MGFVIVIALGLYLLISIGVVAWAVSHAKKHGKSAMKWGWSAAFIMYLIPFWDWIPTVAAHKYYCSTEAGFWVYKTLDQWKKENSGVMEGLVDNSPQEYPNWPKEDWRGKSISNINQRIGLLHKSHLFNPSKDDKLFLNVWRWQSELIDKKTGEVLAQKIDFSASNGYIGGEPEFKFWLHRDNCDRGYKSESVIKFNDFLIGFRGNKQ